MLFVAVSINYTAIALPVSVFFPSLQCCLYLSMHFDIVLLLLCVLLHEKTKRTRGANCTIDLEAPEKY